MPREHQSFEDALDALVEEWIGEVGAAEIILLLDQKAEDMDTELKGAD
jgi:hypothetical protein